MLENMVDVLTVTEADNIWVKGYTTSRHNGYDLKNNVVINLKNIIKYEWLESNPSLQQDNHSNFLKKKFEIPSGIKADPDPELKSLDLVENAKTLAELRVEQQKNKQKEIKDFLSSKEIKADKENYGLPSFKKRP